MVAPLRPGKFYGSALPRPRFYSDVKFNPDGIRVDAPPKVLDPLLSWAHDAHWSMGGLSFLRHRLQGRIEGNVRRLQAQRGRKIRLLAKNEKVNPSRRVEEEIDNVDSSSSSSSGEEATPRADLHRRASARVRKLVGYEEESGMDLGAVAIEIPQPKKKRARKLGDEFDRVAEIDGGISPSVKGSASPPSVGKGKSKVSGVPVLRRSRRITVSPSKN